MKQPLVSIILLCCNQADYVEEAIRSVLAQPYPNLEVIIVDDASTDNSCEVIRSQIAGAKIEFISLKANLGNCGAFNRGFHQSKGDYVIDLAADDVLHADKVSEQVSQFLSLPDDYGVIYSDARLIDAEGNYLGLHSDRVRKIGRVKDFPTGIIFEDVVANYFICSPTQMIKRQVLEELGGYDESLYYEDFDFWVRSARNWKYGYLSAPLMTVRKTGSGMSADMYGPTDRKVESTLLVCRKILELVQSEGEKRALIQRVRYEFNMAWKHRNRAMMVAWYELLRELNANKFADALMVKFR